MCADMGTSTNATLQNTVDGDWGKGASYILAIDTCENLKKYTKAEDCEPAEDLLNDFIVIAKIGYEFYQTEDYVSKKQLSYNFQLVSQPLSTMLYQHKSYNIEPNDVKVNSLFLYSDQLITSYDKFTVFTPWLEDAWSLPSSIKQAFVEDSGFGHRFTM